MDRTPIANAFVCVLTKLMPLQNDFGSTSCDMSIRKNTIETYFC